METKPLLYGLIGFFLGGFIVSVAAVTFEKEPQATDMHAGMQTSVEMLEGKSGDAFDAAFIADMIMHHQGAVDMAKLSESRAKHNEIKQLSQTIIAAQEKEIADMRQWQQEWGYKSGATDTAQP